MHSNTVYHVCVHVAFLQPFKSIECPMMEFPVVFLCPVHFFASDYIISLCVCGIVFILLRFRLQELYESVKKEQFKVPDGEKALAETFFNPEKQGWLTKEGGRSFLPCSSSSLLRATSYP